jgi:hypothetical protein
MRSVAGTGTYKATAADNPDGLVQAVYSGRSTAETVVKYSDNRSLLTGLRCADIVDCFTRRPCDV